MFCLKQILFLVAPLLFVFNMALAEPGSSHDEPMPKAKPEEAPVIAKAPAKKEPTGTSENDPLPYPIGGLSSMIWEALECRSDGVCIYQNIDTRKKVYYKKDDKVIPASAKENAAKDKEKATAKTAEELETDKKALSSVDVASKADFENKIRASARAGKEYIIIQVGNLAGCPPCQALDKALKASDLVKSGKTAVFDFNYLNNQKDTAEGNELLKLLHKNYGLPPNFGFPYTYVFHIPKGETWPNQFHGLGNDKASVAWIENQIKSFSDSK